MKVNVEFPIKMNFERSIDGYYFASRLSRVFNFLVFELDLGLQSSDGKYHFEFYNNKQVRDERLRIHLSKMK